MIDLRKGDCLEIMRGMPDKCIDLIVTDPPYELDMFHKGGGVYADKKHREEVVGISSGFAEEILDEMVRVMKRINIYLWCSREQMPKLYNYFVGKHKCKWNLLTWHKDNPVPACGQKYLNDTEYIMYFKRGGVKLYGTYETKFTYRVTHLNTADKALYGHPTIKPVGYLRDLVLNSSVEGDVVLDPFMGSGSTGVACKMLGRSFIGCEINERYFQIAQRRLAEDIQIKMF